MLLGEKGSRGRRALGRKLPGEESSQEKLRSQASLIKGPRRMLGHHHPISEKKECEGGGRRSYF